MRALKATFYQPSRIRLVTLNSVRQRKNLKSKITNTEIKKENKARMIGYRKK